MDLPFSGQRSSLDGRAGTGHYIEWPIPRRLRPRAGCQRPLCFPDQARERLKSDPDIPPKLVDATSITVSLGINGSIEHLCDRLRSKLRLREDERILSVVSLAKEVPRCGVRREALDIEPLVHRNVLAGLDSPRHVPGLRREVVVDDPERLDRSGLAPSVAGSSSSPAAASPSPFQSRMRSPGGSMSGTVIVPRALGVSPSSLPSARTSAPASR